MHNHAAPGVAGVPSDAAPPLFDDNLIIDNVIAGNAADSEDAATSGPTGINLFSVGPIRGTVITQNVIDNEALDIVINIPAIASVTTPLVQIHLNDLLSGVGVTNTGTGTVDATQNWWGCSGGPGASGCTTVSGNVPFAPWLRRPFDGRRDDHRDH
jgi:hypothetical protein